MDPLGSNKWLAAILASVLLILLINTYTDSIFGNSHGEGHDGGELKVAYGIEVAEAASALEATEIEAPSIAVLLATASADKGAREFAKCKACHTADAGGKNGTGPNLYNLVGRPIGNNEGFKYSAALTGQTGSWDYTTLDAWIASPKNTFPGTSMSFAGLKKPEARADLIAFLRMSADSPVALPSDAVEELAQEIVEDVAH